MAAANNSHESSWAYQWDPQPAPQSYTTFSDSGGSSSSKFAKTKAAASTGAKKVKAGLLWIKNKYHKATTKQ